MMVSLVEDQFLYKYNNRYNEDIKIEKIKNNAFLPHDCILSMFALGIAPPPESDDRLYKCKI